MFQQPEDCSSQIAAVGWRADLIRYDAQLVTFRCQAQDRFYEVFTAGPIKPTGAHDKIALQARREDGFFPCQFRAAISAERVRRIGLKVGPRLIAGKNIVGRNMNEDSPHLSCGFSQVTGAGAIDLGRQLFMNFAVVDIGESRTVDNHRRLEFFHLFQDLQTICQVKIRKIITVDAILRWRDFAHLAGQHAARTDQG